LLITSYFSLNFGTNFGEYYIPTTDRQGANGYNNTAGVAGNYTQNFNGTSSACPHVAAVAALILSINPQLTVQQVNNIIEFTAQKVGGYNYQTTAGRGNGTWHNEMGYGLIDANAALLKAFCQTTTINNNTYNSNSTINGCKVILNNVKVQNGAKLTVNANQDVTVNPEFEVTLGSELQIK
jgi:subtilisin family serine protease